MRKGSPTTTNDDSVLHGSPTMSHRSAGGCSIDEDKEIQIYLPELSYDEQLQSENEFSSSHSHDVSPCGKTGLVGSPQACIEAETWRSNSRYISDTPLGTPILMREQSPFYLQEGRDGGQWVYYPPPVIIQGYSRDSSFFYRRSCLKDDMYAYCEGSDSGTPRSLVDYNLDL